MLKKNILKFGVWSGCCVCTNGFLEKNQDPMHSDFIQLMSKFWYKGTFNEHIFSKNIYIFNKQLIWDRFFYNFFKTPIFYVILNKYKDSFNKKMIFKLKIK
jgi:hypothetical protein